MYKSIINIFSKTTRETKKKKEKMKKPINQIEMCDRSLMAENQQSARAAHPQSAPALGSRVGTGIGIGINWQDVIDTQNTFIK